MSRVLSLSSGPKAHDRTQDLFLAGKIKLTLRRLHSLKSCLSVMLHPLPHTLRLYLNTITAGAVKIYFIDKVKQGALGVCAVCRQNVEQEFVF